MSQKRMRRGMAVVAVLAVLLLAPPAQAAGWEGIPPGLLEKAWAWVASWWGAEEGGAGLEKVVQGDGGAIDPNGAPSAGNRPTSACGDDGGCIDPNG